ncbi:hypothetical protein F4861DRAFT_112438 [Xylaria intraflava]|nr:hypothetical protein F4861DRAFT_112438 [Xylaria intraflava]
MAHYIESAPEVSSSALNLSFSDVLGDTKIRPSLVKIPSAQKQLLSRHESWASFLSRRPKNGFVNIPPAILEQLKDSYKRQKHATEPHETAESTNRAGRNTHAPEPSGSQPSPRPVSRDDGAGSGNDSDHNTQLSWSLSPDPNRRPAENESKAPNQPFITQLSDKSPPQPTIITSTGSTQLPDFTQSSQGPEDELEVEVPAALAHNPIPINRSALPMLATPPSAQIPCTFEQSTQSTSTGASANPDPQPKPQPRQTRYRAIPQLYQPPRQNSTSLGSKTNAGASRPVADTRKKDDVESSSPADNTSSSVVPSTIASDQGLNNKDILTHDTTLKPQDQRNPVSYRPPSPTRIPPAPPQVPPVPQPAAPITRRISPPAEASKDRETPFVHYTTTYPSYAGTIQDFLTACSYLQGQHRRIRTSLYDDFIRAWVEGYLPYVEECDAERPSRQALEAIEWYNEIDDDPLFTSRVVTRLNLPSILKSHLDRMETSIGDLSRQRLNEDLSFRNHTAPNARKKEISREPTRRQEARAKSPAREPMELDAKVPNISSNVDPEKPLHPAHSYISVHSGIETHQAHPEASRRSLPETVSRKRPAVDELHSERTQRISRDSTPDLHSNRRSDSSGALGYRPGRPSSISRSSVAPEPTARGPSVETITDLEKRKQRLAKHFKKRMAGK